MEVGRLIILEGGEGAGKSTLVKNLEKELSGTGLRVVCTREPGGTPWGEKIRSLLIEKDSNIDHHLSPAAQLLGHYMARFEHLERVILPALSSGKTVISDRFEISSYAYQVYALGDTLLENIFADLHKYVVEQLRPYQCIYFFCDLDPAAGLARVDGRGEKKTIFDEAAIEFHEKVREGMKKAQAHIDSHFTCHTIDASDSEEGMLRQAVNLLR
ncbi:dTMP kinase [Candidatus Kaiserbacteria bacterium]|nr:dTMP kinase [Candidatus Kaiserbacteria bacterium]